MKTMPLPDDMLAFEAIARCGSLTAAADALGCTKSWVSLRLKSLEKQLGAVLVLRTTRRLALTEAGERLLPHARALRRALEEAQPSVDSAQLAVEGRLALSTSVSMSQVLAPLLAELASLQPGLRLELRVDNRVQDPIADVLDFCLRGHRVHDETLVARSAGWVEEGLFASPDYLAARGWPQHPDDLLTHGLFSHAEAEPLQLYRDETMLSLHCRPMLLSSDAYVVCQDLALRGLGITMLPHYMAAEHCRAGRLVQVLPQWRGERWPVLLVYPFRQPMPRKYQALLDFLLPRLPSALGDRV